MMKAYISIFFLMAFSVFASAQSKVFPVHAAAVIKDEDGNMSPQQIWVLAATGATVRYLERADDTEFKDQPMANVISYYFFESSDYIKAVDLYQARKYKEARDEFAKIKKQCQPLVVLKNSPGVMAAFYEMECMRNMNDIEALSKALREFKKDSLTHEMHKRQLELYVLWESLKAKNWDRIESLAAEFKKTKLPGSQLAQVEHCLGRAREATGKIPEALLSYQLAMTADCGASEVVARESALRVMEILNDDADLKAAIKVYENTNGKILASGYTKVLEASGVARLYELSLGAGTPLPAKFQHLLKYKPQSSEKGASEAKEGEKKEEPKAEADKKIDPKAAADQKADPKVEKKNP